MGDSKTLHFKLSIAVTEYDRRQSRKRFYNPYAISHYLKAVQDVCDEVDKGETPRNALVNHFCGRLLDVTLKAIGEAKSTDAEQRIGLHFK